MRMMEVRPADLDIGSVPEPRVFLTGHFDLEKSRAEIYLSPSRIALGVI